MKEGLANLYRVYGESEEDHILKSRRTNQDSNRIYLSFLNINAYVGLGEYFLKQDILASKKRFAILGQVAEYANNSLKSTWLTAGFRNYTYSLCSDHLELIKRMGSLTIHEVIRETRTTENCIMFAMMSLIREDWEEVEYYISVLKGFMKKAQHSPYTPLNILTLEAFRDNDGDKLKKALEGYENKKLKAHRKKIIPDEKYVSVGTLGFLKLAWLRGMEIEAESEYLPKEWLPHRPLEEYTIPYWFLRDYYREQGVGWRYEPVYPELQKEA